MFLYFIDQPTNPKKQKQLKNDKISKKRKPASSCGQQFAVVTPPDLNQFSIVWVKIRGYKYWPGVIEKEIKGSYKIHFFGDYTNATVKKNRLTDFYEGFGLFKYTFDDVKLKKAIQEACICMMNQTKQPDSCLVCQIVNK